MNAGSASADLISAGLNSMGEDSAVSDSSVSDLDRRFRLALLLYVVLAALAWFTLGEGTIFVGGRQVELRWLPLVVLGGLALRTVIARQAEKIRREGDGEIGSTPRRLQKKS
jgi:hypothetical protein